MLYTTIKTQIKEAMKSKSVIKRDVLKMVVNKAKIILKESNPNDNGENISDEIMLQAIRKELKQLEQTKTALELKSDSDLYKETVEKISVLSGYLPKLMNKEEVEDKVKEILSTNEYANFGLKMKAVMQELKGKADNKLIKEVVENYK